MPRRNYRKNVTKRHNKFLLDQLRSNVHILPELLPPEEELMLVPATTIKEWFTINYITLRTLYVRFGRSKSLHLFYDLTDDVIGELYIVYSRDRSILTMTMDQLFGEMYVIYKNTILPSNWIERPAKTSNRAKIFTLYDENPDTAHKEEGKILEDNSDNHVEDVSMNVPYLDANYTAVIDGRSLETDHNNYSPLWAATDTHNPVKTKNSFKRVRRACQARESRDGWYTVTQIDKLVVTPQMGKTALWKLKQLIRVLTNFPYVPLTSSTILFIEKYYPGLGLVVPMK